MSDHHDDFHIEPVEGLPELPPEGEVILWQGKPNWWALAKDSLALKWVMGYFVFLGAWRSVALMADYTFLVSVKGAVPFLVLGLIVCALLTAIAWTQAITTVYTVTNRRVAMRIGAALTITYNFPYRWIGAAHLDLRKSGIGTIAMELMGETRMSYLNCWPHVRPWHIRDPQPALRCIPNAEHVAELIADAAQTQVARVDASATTPDGAQTAPEAGPVPAE
ncbi:MAG: photosynthetic complex putative assembly protein PuhB [Dinoroseobacter sp.]|nr:photosynthetic complex putative assembly protein PuhB [Dinoroseobacter sp.]